MRRDPAEKHVFWRISACLNRAEQAESAQYLLIGERSSVPYIPVKELLVRDGNNCSSPFFIFNTKLLNEFEAYIDMNQHGAKNQQYCVPDVSFQYFREIGSNGVSGNSSWIKSTSKELAAPLPFPELPIVTSAVSEAERNVSGIRIRLGRCRCI